MGNPQLLIVRHWKKISNNRKQCDTSTKNIKETVLICLLNLAMCFGAPTLAKAHDASAFLYIPGGMALYHIICMLSIPFIKVFSRRILRAILSFMFIDLAFWFFIFIIFTHFKIPLILLFSDYVVLTVIQPLILLYLLTRLLPNKSLFVMTVSLMAFDCSFYGGIKGTVLDNSTGNPIEGAIVVAQWAKERGTPRMQYHNLHFQGGLYS